MKQFTIKPLVWIEVPKAICVARPFGNDYAGTEYIIGKDCDEMRHPDKFRLWLCHECAELFFNTIDEAKVCAEEDWQSRLLLALDPA